MPLQDTYIPKFSNNLQFHMLFHHTKPQNRPVSNLNTAGIPLVISITPLLKLYICSYITLSIPCIQSILIKHILTPAATFIAVKNSFFKAAVNTFCIIFEMMPRMM